MKSVFSLWLFLFGMVSAAAQNTFRVEGKVTDFHNNATLQGAKITLGNKTAVSGPSGIFVFENIAAGNYLLTAAHPECEPFSQQITVDRSMEINITLEHHVETIEEIQITGVHRTTGSVSVKTLDKTAISRNTTENLGNLLSSVSGVQTMKTGNNIAKPVIRGLYGSRILVYSNDVRMAEQEWGVEHAPSIDANAFERIRVIKGAGTLKYGGDAVGGVIALEPRKFPARDSIMGSVTLSGISNGKGGSIGADLAKTWENGWFAQSQGGYKKLGDISIPKTTLQNTGTEEHTFSFGTGYRSFDKGINISYNGLFQEFGIFRGSHLGAAEEFVNAVNNQQVFYTGDFSYSIDNPKQEVNHHLAKIEAFKRFGNIGKITAQYAFQLNRRKEFDIRRGEYSLLPSMDLQLITHSGKLEHLLERSSWQLESGLNVSVQDNYPNPETKARRLIPDYFRYDAGAFTHFRYDISQKMKAEAGLRYDANVWDAYKYYDESEWEERFADLFPQFVIQNSGSRVLTRPQFTFHNFSANAGFTFRPNENLSLQLGYSRSSRSPNAAELFADGLHHSASIIERGNLAIEQENVNQINFSADLRLDLLSGMRLEVNPYLMQSDSFINQVPTGALLTIRGIFPVWDYQQIEARVFGLDADLEVNFTNNLKLNSAFSWLRGDDLTNDEPLILMSPLKLYNTLELGFLPKQNGFLQIAHSYSGYQSRFPVRNFSVPVLRNGILFQAEVDVSTPPSAYHLWNISAGANLLQNFSLQVSVQNIFNTEYRDYLNRLRYFSPEMGRNVIVSLKYNF